MPFDRWIYIKNDICICIHTIASMKACQGEAPSKSPPLPTIWLKRKEEKGQKNYQKKGGKDKVRRGKGRRVGERRRSRVERRSEEKRKNEEKKMARERRGGKREKRKF